jgi:UDP-glucuronate 4-epimerase
VTALVTGCAGFIGSHLTEALLADGERVLGVDCFNDNYGRSEKLDNLRHAQAWDGFEFVPVDLARGDLPELIEECGVIYHLAAEPGVRHSWGRRFELYARNNVLATQQLLEAARARPGIRFVHASSSSVYGQAECFPTPESALPRPRSPYGVTKLASEQLCDSYREGFGVDAVSLRLFSVYGPRQRPDMAFRRFCDAAVSGTPIEVFGDGLQTRDFTYVSDVVAALRLAAAHPGPRSRTLNVGGGARVGLRAALAKIEDLCGRPLEVRRLGAQAGDVSDTGADISLAREVLGFAPQVGLEEGLARQLEWAERRAPVLSA